MILTKEQLEKRLNSPDNVVNRLKEGNTTVIVKKEGCNNPNGNLSGNRLTDEERVQVGVLTALEGPQVAADVFGITKSHASDLKNAYRTVAHGSTGKDSIKGFDIALREKIQERLDQTKLTVSEIAAERLMRTLGVITDDKLDNCSAKDAAGIANQMSQVMRNMNQSRGSEGKPTSNVRIVLNKPKEINESSFDIIEVQAG